MLKIEPTKNTPHILIDAELGIMEFSGRCTSTETTHLFDGVKKCIEEYANNPKPITRINIKIEYFNTSSISHLERIFNILNNANTKVVVDWFYEPDDDDVLELGEDFADVNKNCEFTIRQI